MAFKVAYTNLLMRAPVSLSRSRYLSKPITVVSGSTPPEKEIQLRPPRENTLKIIARTKEQDGSITVEGRATPSPQKAIVDMEKGACPLCSLGIEVHYTDVLILKQFIRKDGVLLPRVYTGLCAKQQRRMDMMVHKAHNAGLLDCLQPPLADGRVRKPKKESKYKFRGLNRYFTDDY